MVLIFSWLPARVDPASWNAPPGTPVTIVAMVKPDALRRVTLDIPAGLSLDDPATQSVPDIKKTLEEYRDTKLKPNDLSNQPWEVRESAERYAAERRADLNDYLQHIPAIPISWTIRTPPTAGAWAATVRADGAKTLTTTLVTGDAKPPQPAELTNTPNDPLQSLKITYAASAQKKTVFAPIGHREWGWLGVYLLAYLPIMFGLRAALRIA
jgi:hypothetical protein